MTEKNPGSNETVLSMLGNGPPYSCALHLERSVEKQVCRVNRREFKREVGEILKQHSLGSA